ncbi:MAG: T9SS type A sorting domain-containing protein [Flavobacteriales bacterium]|nr:T9SS type A sorting domain-containing protein [Flavobacteriales bacterium]
MKLKTIVSFLFIMWSWSCLAQCSADAGPDAHLCKVSGFEMQLGGNPTATVGYPPFVYEWSIEPIELSAGLVFWSSTFLNDTTVANPNLTDTWGDEMVFYLEVTDSLGNQCWDTVNVSISEFAISTVTYHVTLPYGDSIQLNYPNVSSNRPIAQVLWNPSQGLSDSTAIQPWARPQSDVTYGCTIWDTAGCSIYGGPFQYLVVQPNGMSEEDKSASASFYPNPVVGNHLLCDDASQITDVRVLNILGVAVSVEWSGNGLELPNDLPSGIYLLQVVFHDSEVSYQRIVKP